MIGIYDCFGYGDGYEVPFDERYKLIKDAGFDSVMLWWSDKFGRGNGYQEDVKFARNAGLYIENIQIAFENIDNLQNLALVLNRFPMKNVGFCYDSCHHINYASNEDLLKLYGDRLMALHLQDNGGLHNQHQLPHIQYV